MPASLFKNERTTRERIEKFISPHHFLDVNLRGRLFPQKTNVPSINHVDCKLSRPSFAQATHSFRDKASKVSEGFSFGPTWSTHWFLLSWDSLPPKNHCKTFLLWNSECEAMVWSLDGNPLQGLSSDFDRVLFEIEAGIGSVYVECAANDLFGAGDGGMIEPTKLDKTFTIKEAKIVQRNESIYNLLIDLEIMHDMVLHLDKDNHTRFKALYTANTMINTIVKANHSQQGYTQAKYLADQFFALKNGDSMMQLHAVGNCHIDTAWLWPYGETRRKTARSWTTTLKLMRNFSHLNFAVSQAQQLSWLSEDYPSLMSPMKNAFKSGRLIGVGGCWVEMDGNMPSGESFVRQTLYGQKLFKEVTGSYCSEFWLPDTFGYSAQLPQIMSQAGMKRFVTQKISWNLVNKFPHHTFWWAGLDGSKVITHFPPNDDYVSKVKVEELVKSYKNFQDKGRSNAALFLYGFGDGGGGPSEDMLTRMKRLQDVHSLPKVSGSTPSKYFEHVESKELGNLCTWHGELFLELHNATYTSQAAVKAKNRKCENLLRDAELLSVFDWLFNDVVRDWSGEWKKVLLNQFHDVLPGSSIAQVYQDAIQLYNEVEDSCRAHFYGNASLCLLNSLAWPRTVYHNNIRYTIPGISLIPLKSLTETPLPQNSFLTHSTKGEGILVSNQYFNVTFDNIGRIESLFVKDLQLIASEKGRGNELCIYDDVPLYWDAWDVMDYHLETRSVLDSAVQKLRVLQADDACVKLQFSVAVGEKSLMTQVISIRIDCPYIEFEAEIDWKEKHKMLKAEFEMDVQSARASYEVQYGHLQRPNHSNTSWDSAQFEVCAQKWADLSDSSGGCALLNDSKYGYSCVDQRLSLSLLRAPTAPDKECDIALHSFKYALMPYMGTFLKPENCDLSVLQAASELNSPVRVVHRDLPSVHDLYVFDGGSEIVIDAIKLSEDKEAIVLRVYEASGGTKRAKLRAKLNITQAFICNNMEDKIEQITVQENNTLLLKFTAFEYKSLLLYGAK